MLYTFSNVQIKNNDWKVASIKGADGSQAHEVSINRTNKKGEVFPNFDAIADGASVEGNLWKSDAGKNYLFAPKEGGRKGGGNNLAISQAQERKVASIKTAMDSKEYAIKVSSTFRDATLILIELIKAGKVEVSDWKNQHAIVRSQLWTMFDVEGGTEIF